MELHHSSEQEAPKKVTKLFLNTPLAYFPPRPNRFASPPPGVERLNRGSPHKQIERAHASTMQINRGPLAVVLPAGKTTVRQALRDRGGIGHGHPPCLPGAFDPSRSSR